MTAAELVRDELALSPERTARIVRMTAIVALVVVISMALRVPEAAVSAYMIFFFAQRDVALTVIGGAAALVALTVVVALALVFYLVALDEPGLRLPLMVALAFGGLYLMRATAAGPLGLIFGFVLFYGLTFADQYPSPEALVRGLCWLWVVILYPIALLVIADVAFGARPDQVYRKGIAARLGVAAAFLGAPPERETAARAALLRGVRLGTRDLVPYVERSGSPATAPLRGTLLRQIELLGLLLRELPAELRHGAAARQALARAGLACDAARRALLGTDGAATIAGHFELLAAERRALATATPATRAVVLPLVDCLQTIVLSVRELAAVPSPPSLRAAKPEPPASRAEAVRFALKTTLAATTAYLLYSGLEWYSIHTATITCFFVAEDSVGATVHKLALRLGGAVIGAALGMLAILFVLPALESVGGLVVVVAAVTLLAAWVGTASPRIAYAGWQIAIAFYLTVLQGFSRTSKLYVGRDRVIGILIGNILMSVVFTSLWPVRAAPEQRTALARAVEALAALLRAAPGDRDALDRAEAELYAQLNKARQYQPLLRFERAHDDGSSVLTAVQGLFIPIHAIVRTPVPESASAEAQATLTSGRERVSAWLSALATSIAAQAAPPPPPEPGVEARQDVDHLAWLELLRAQCVALAERRPT